MGRRTPPRLLGARRRNKRTVRKAYVLDAFSHGDIQRWADASERTRKYHWDYYSHLAHLRAEIFDQLKESLATKTRAHVISNWCRIVPNKFVNAPLSAQGSVLNEVGGRFNIGSIDETLYSKFPALYVGEDFEAAFREKFGVTSGDSTGGLRAEEMAFCAKDSFSVFSLSGRIESVLDINDPSAVEPFVNLISRFKMPRTLMAKAKSLRLPAPSVVSDVASLLKTLFDPNWRINATAFNVPAGPQLFGQIVHAAGIEGILYRSKHGHKNCLAVFPENFKSSDSYIEINGELAATLQPKRLDASTWASTV